MRAPGLQPRGTCGLSPPRLLSTRSIWSCAPRESLQPVYPATAVTAEMLAPMGLTHTGVACAQGQGQGHGPRVRAEEGEDGQGEGRLPAHIHPRDQHPALLPAPQHRQRVRGARRCPTPDPTLPYCRIAARWRSPGIMRWYSGIVNVSEVRGPRAAARHTAARRRAPGNNYSVNVSPGARRRALPRPAAARRRGPLPRCHWRLDTARGFDTHSALLGAPPSRAACGAHSRCHRSCPACRGAGTCCTPPARRACPRRPPAPGQLVLPALHGSALAHAP